MAMQIAEFGVLSQAIVYRRSCLSTGDDLSWNAGFGISAGCFVPRSSCAVPPSCRRKRPVGSDRHLRRSGELDRAGHAPWLGHPAQTAATVAGFLR
jgi:hypothetical protein